jgi:hypothetical protein
VKRRKEKPIGTKASEINVCLKLRILQNLYFEKLNAAESTLEDSECWANPISICCFDYRVYGQETLLCIG